MTWFQTGEKLAQGYSASQQTAHLLVRAYDFQLSTLSLGFDDITKVYFNNIFHAKDISPNPFNFVVPLSETSLIVFFLGILRPKLRVVFLAPKFYIRIKNTF